MGGKALSPKEGRDSGLTAGDVSCLQGALSPSFQMPLLNVWGFLGGSIPSSWESLSPSCRFFIYLLWMDGGCPPFCSVPFPPPKGALSQRKGALP